ncbi:leukocyte elastase inhibitor-like [Oryzias latipes]|uniref:leukocyte elastase inhibitor-like n=1 Tax=Oryzias latipes TaxID=8090 RepID=UPI0009DA61E1|nr:leukocyte elastase inhibitor-like [Oryzias latipes]
MRVFFMCLISQKDKNPVMMMRQEAKFPYVEIPEIDCQILEMPYEGKELSMLIFLPQEILDESTGLERLEKLLTYDKIMEWTSPEKMPLTKVDVRLPRFKMEEKYNLKKVLTRMGMVDAFDDRKCNFSGKMCESSQFTMSNECIHRRKFVSSL